VDYLDGRIFGEMINPFVIELVQTYIPAVWMQSLIIGEYGVYSLGFRFAVAIILPIVGTFFLMFAILEDSGYLPRLAMLVDRLFKNFGLNGRAVIPVALGLGCGTMAVVVTRTLETRRERVLATFLLSLTIPCSAQLGVVLALLAHNTQILLLWLVYVSAIFVIVGWLSAKVLPGEHSAFYLEIPPLRCPQLTNVFTKAYTRMACYFWEIMPVFVATSVVLWIVDYAGVLASLISAIEPIIHLLGLPSQTAGTFLLGFFRRDYGAAGLYEMTAAGLLSDYQLLVAAVTITLFVPCIAQLTVMVKERGIVTSSLMVLLIAMISIASGWLINILLSWL
jgi:ferrous iron transport protein B